MREFRSLTQRLKEALWAQDWPAEIGGPLQIQTSSPSPKAHGWLHGWYERRGLYRALAQTPGYSTTLSEAHAALDRLERFTDNYRDDLAFPPSRLNFARVLLKAVGRRDEDVLDVLTAYSDACVLAFAAVPAEEWAPYVTTYDRNATEAVRNQGRHAALLEMFRPGAVALTANLPAPDLSAPPVAVIEAAPAPAPSVPPAAAAHVVTRPVDKKERRYFPSEMGKSITEWATTMIGRLDKMQHQPVALRKEWMDNQIKDWLTEGKVAEESAKDLGKWVREEFIPTLARLPEAQMYTLIDAWPEHRQLPVGEPAEWVGEARLWAAVRDSENSALLLSVLPKIVDSEAWSFEQRHAMLEPMFHLVKANRQTFDERLQLWEALGGDLDEEITQVATREGGDMFGSPPTEEVLSARRWFHEKAVPMQLEFLATERSTPPARSRPRM